MGESLPESFERVDSHRPHHTHKSYVLVAEIKPPIGGVARSRKAVCSPGRLQSLKAQNVASRF